MPCSCSKSKYISKPIVVEKHYAIESVWSEDETKRVPFIREYEGDYTVPKQNEYLTHQFGLTLEEAKTSFADLYYKYAKDNGEDTNNVLDELINIEKFIKV
jgi:hypothetical protein